jgi:predicted metal-dependent hydrolase
MIRLMSLSGTVLRFILPKAVPEPEQLTIAHAGDTLPVTFVRSRRARRASLRVDAAGRRIVLTAPLRMARATAVGFAQAQAGWIAARLKRLPTRRPFVDGAELPLFGEPHRVRHRNGVRGTVWRDGSEIHVAGRPEHLPRRLRDWLTAVAHLVHLNHGPRFWALARALCDGPIEAPQAWLRKNGEILLQYGA